MRLFNCLTKYAPFLPYTNIGVLQGLQHAFVVEENPQHGWGFQKAFAMLSHAAAERLLGLSSRGAFGVYITASAVVEQKVQAV